MWGFIVKWESVEKSIKNLPFYEVSFEEILNLIDEATLYHEDLRKEQKELADLMEHHLFKMHNFKAQIVYWKDMRQDFIKIWHWNEIFKLLKWPQLMADKSFTLEEILSLWIDERAADVRYIIEQARREHKYEILIRDTIAWKYESLKLQIVKFKEIDGQ